jgi:hypothetical protein
MSVLFYAAASSKVRVEAVVQQESTCPKGKKKI